MSEIGARWILFIVRKVKLIGLNEKQIFFHEYFSRG